MAFIAAILGLFFAVIIALFTEKPGLLFAQKRFH